MNVKILPNKIIGVTEIGKPKIKTTQPKNHLQHTVRLVSPNKTQIQFQYNSSINKYNYGKGKPELSKDDLLDAVFVFLNDSAYYINIYDELDLAAEFGYSLDSKEDVERVRKIWKSLTNQHNKAKKLGLSDDDIFNSLEYMSEIYGM